MQIILDEVKRHIQAVPVEKLPMFLAALAGMTAIVQMRMTMAGSAPVVREAEELLTVPQVAQRLNMSSYRIYELCRTGTLQSVKCGKSIRVKPSAVTEFLAKQGG